MAKCNLKFRKGSYVVLNGEDWRDDDVGWYKSVQKIEGTNPIDGRPFFFFNGDPEDIVDIYVTRFVDYSARKARRGER